MNSAIAACLEVLGGEAWILDGPQVRRQNSRISRACSGDRAIAIKECFEPRTTTPDPRGAEREFAALERLSAAAAPGEPPLAPLPLAICRERAAYAMTWVSGRSATELLLARSTSSASAAALGEAAGTWLRRMHACRALPPRRGDFESQLAQFEQLSDAEQGPDRLLRRAAKALARHARAASAVRIPASWVHGDMKTDNLLVDGARVTGLDVHLMHENAVVYDLAPFLNHLSLLRWTARGIGQPKKLTLMGEGFLHAYSADAARWKLPLAWLRVYLFLQVAAATGKSWSPTALATRLPARMELRRVTDHLEWLCQGTAS